MDGQVSLSISYEQRRSFYRLRLCCAPTCKLLRACLGNASLGVGQGLESRLQAVSAPDRLKAGLQTHFRTRSQADLRVLTGYGEVF
jgi:hypothetical protein